MVQKNKVYTLSEFCKILRESQEFKPTMGKNVESEDKKNNGKAVEDIIKDVKKFDGGLTDEKKKEQPRDTTDFNKTTLDVDFNVEPSKDYKERVKSQVHGFPSVKNEKESKIKEENKGVDFQGNEDFYKDRDKIANMRADRRYTLKKSGLQSREMADNNKEFDKELEDKTIYTNESKKMKRLNFSKTVFLNENHMLNKIPDDMKFDGNKFYMKDSVGNEYLIECVKDKFINDFVHTKVVDFKNKEMMNETFNRMKELYKYQSEPVKQNTGKYENNMVGSMLKEAKDKLIQKD